jgi:hypothetical protein
MAETELKKRPQDDEMRPRARRQLPFRKIQTTNRGFPAVEIEYWGEVVLPLTGQVQRMPFLCTEAHGIPLHKAILELMDLYWALEREMDGLVRDKEEAQKARVLVEGQLRRETKRANELEARMKRERNGP